MLLYSPLDILGRTVWQFGRRGLFSVEKEEISLGFDICWSKLHVVLLKTQPEKYIIQVL